MGSLPSENHGLIQLMHDEHTTSSLAHMISHAVKNPLISTLFNIFTSVCMLTAFLGVSLCLMSFLSDGLNMKQKGRHGVGLFLITFLPPLLIVTYYPGVYLNALQYAGYFCVILLLLLPACMSLFGRPKHPSSFIVPGGKITQCLVIISSIALMLSTLWGRN